MIKIQQDFLNWWKAEKVKGLKSLHFTGKRTDSLLQELMQIDQAIAEKKSKPFLD